MIPSAAMEMDRVSLAIMPEFDRYGELIVAGDAQAVGLLVRGEGEDFTRRVSELMESWGMTEEARHYHRHLAEAFEHKRIFLKLEWCQVEQQVERQMAVYYRRRPSVHEALRILSRFTGTSVPVEVLRELGMLLGKDTVHFVAFTARPDRPIWHKFYFSQYLTPVSGASSEVRLQRAVARFARESTQTERWAAYHDRLAPRYRIQTAFVSLAVTEDGPDGSLKIDYPEVSPVVAAGLLDGPEAERAYDRLQRLCDAAGQRALSYLGVRIGVGKRLVLKGYADFI